MTDPLDAFRRQGEIDAATPLPVPINWKVRAEKAEQERDALLARQDRNEKAMDIIDRAAKLLEAEPDMPAQIASLKAERDMLRAALERIAEAAQKWCDAVDRDPSWDGWDHHFKAMKYKLLPGIRAALEAKP